MKIDRESKEEKNDSSEIIIYSAGGCTCAYIKKEIIHVISNQIFTLNGFVEDG